MRITDIALSTPASGARPAAARRAGGEAPSPSLTRGAPRGAAHPDEVAASALARAAGLASAGRVVAAANADAAASVRGDLLDPSRLPALHG